MASDQTKSGLVWVNPFQYYAFLGADVAGKIPVYSDQVAGTIIGIWDQASGTLTLGVSAQDDPPVTTAKGVAP